MTNHTHAGESRTRITDLEGRMARVEDQLTRTLKSDPAVTLYLANEVMDRLTDVEQQLASQQRAVHASVHAFLWRNIEHTNGELSS